MRQHFIAYCKVCNQEWDMDYDPVGCTCDDPPDDAWEINLVEEDD